MTEGLRDVLLRRIERWEQRGKELAAAPPVHISLRLIGMCYLDRADELRHDLEAVSDD